MTEDSMHASLDAALARTAPDAAGIEAALAAGLAAHRLVGFTVCRCGAQIADPMEGGEEEWEAAHRAHVAAALLPLVTQAQAEALREAAQVWRGFVADGRCPTCQMGRSRETVGMVCQTCGTDYARADESGAK